MSDETTTVTFLGTGSLLPGPGHDAPCCVINRRIMVDAGYYGAQRLKSWGMGPGQIDHLLITHHHPDHTLGLALLFCLRRALPFVGEQVRDLTILGPAGGVEKAVRLTRTFLQIPESDHVANVAALQPGGSYETEDFLITTCAARHSEPGLVYRLRDKRTSAELAMTGDTAPDPAIVEHVRGVDLLVHDANLGLRSAAGMPDAQHSGAPDAARCAKEAGVKRLALIHGDSGPAAVAAAREVFANTFWPEDGQVVEL